MHGDMESLFGGGHELLQGETMHHDTMNHDIASHDAHDLISQHDMVHHDLHGHDALDEAPLLAMSMVEAAGQISNLGRNLVHLLRDTAHQADLHHHGLEHQDQQADPDISDQRGWHAVGGPTHDVHLHLLKHSEAKDSNADGISDAASRDLGMSPYTRNPHRGVDVDWKEANGHLHHPHSKDSDGDGWADDLERIAGTDPFSAASHPSIVEAHHFPAGSDENLPGTFDVTASSSPWLSV